MIVIIIITTIIIIPELSKSRTAHGGCDPFDDMEAWRPGGGRVVFVDLGKKNEHRAKRSRKRSRTKSFEVKSEQIQQLLSEEEWGGGAPPPPQHPPPGGCAPLDPPLFFKPGTHAVVANAGLRLRGL